MTPANAPIASRATVAELTVLALLLSSLVRLATSVYLPALPVIGSDLHMTPHLLTLTMTVYWGLFAVAALFIGPVADAAGRRIVILGGVAIFLAGCIVCTVAPNGPVFLVGRLLQGVGGSAIPVVTLAMVRDVCSDQQLISVLGWMGTLAGLVPIFAPVLGGFLTQHAGWRSNFVVLSVCVALVWCFSLVRLHETLAPERRQRLHPQTSAKAYLRLLTNRAFVGVQLPSIFCFCVQGLYLAVAPFLFIKQLHLSTSVYGLTNLIVVGGLVLGRSLVKHLLNATTVYRACLISALFVVAGGALFVAAWALNLVTVTSVLFPTFVFGIGFGALAPIGLHCIMKTFRDESGTVLALNNAVTLAAAAGSSYLAGVLMTHGTGTMTIIALGNMVCGAGAFLAALANRRSLA